ncbi:bifunctional glycosyltransferase/CDP-glycerol:glycerophosphate glycerophosphotransferase [Bacillus vallismortis]|uniref:bifunctional glycosyltransferase/CDP-glycerol:glycerophosphate glycerophosphotransferase n=1 Tax=Bacillus vallismortis TaxID=72361 RepID=UPI0020908D6A|nr:glycosyltransferase [Bacillus vallismortis]MCO4852876.1 glycosyltransferase [Bacillus vallismortis]
MTHTYDMSIIIPVYNAERYLRKTVESVLQQTYSLEKIEVIFVDDGSADNSVSICQEYSSQFENMKLIIQQNNGVSAARNKGLESATGQYIMFLDSDDLIGKNTVEELVSFFHEVGNETDIVGYPLYSLIGNKVQEHARTKNYKKTGLYDVSIHTNINQTTINVCVRNLPENERVFFDTSLHYAEDATFNTAYIMRTGKMGICSKGRYIYRTHKNSAVWKYRSPVQASSMLLDYFEKVIFNHRHGEKAHPYVQSNVLYELNWRYKSRSLFPFHLEKKEYQKWYDRFLNIMNEIEDEVILKHPHVDTFHKGTFLKLKTEPINVSQDSLGIYIYRNNKMILKQYKFELVITQFNIKNNTLRINGFIKSLMSEFIDLDLFMYVDGLPIKLELVESSHGYYKVRTKTNNFKAFSWFKDIEGLTNLNVTFELRYNQYKYPIAFFFMNDVIFNKFEKNKKAIQNNMLITHLPNKAMFTLKKLPGTEQRKFLKNYNKAVYRKDKKVFLARHLVKKKKSPLWLYNDRVNLIDNGYYQFKHDFAKNDSVRRYYIYDGEQLNLDDLFTQEEKKYVVKFGSRKHKYLFVNATKILTSFRELNEYSPFAEKRMEYFKDLLTYEVVYLQHGILHAHTPWIYSKEKNRIDKFVVSSKFERDNLIKNYNYAPENILETGMPRFDIIKNTDPDENRVIFAPSWRISLAEEKKGNKWTINRELFMKSAYFNKINDLLSSERFIRTLEQQNIIFELKMHPIFKEAENLFHIKSERIKIKNDLVKLEDYKLFITDFSSYLFDFAYLNRPMMFFIPDYDEFLSGNHIYNKLDLDVEESFGQMVNSTEEFVNELTKIAVRGFEPDDLFKIRMNSFFGEKGGHCEKLYNELIKGELPLIKEKLKEFQSIK